MEQKLVERHSLQLMVNYQHENFDIINATSCVDSLPRSTAVGKLWQSRVHFHRYADAFARDMRNP